MQEATTPRQAFRKSLPVCVSSQSCALTVMCVPLELEKTLKRLMFPLGLEGTLMLTTARVEETAWNVGAWRPSGGAGPVLHRVQLLAALPAEFTAHTLKRINKANHNLGTLTLQKTIKCGLSGTHL